MIMIRIGIIIKINWWVKNWEKKWTLLKPARDSYLEHIRKFYNQSEKDREPGRKMGKGYEYVTHMRKSTSFAQPH